MQREKADAPESDRRWITAVCRAIYGPKGATESFELAIKILALRAVRSGKAEFRTWPAADRKLLVQMWEPELSRMLLEAAENGRLSEIASALSQIALPSEHLHDRRHLQFVRAYLKATNVTGREMPTIGEFRTHLRTFLNPLPEDRTIRDILYRLGLPLKSSARGPSRKR